MSGVLSPRLTPLDERVLAALPSAGETGLRARTVTARVNAKRGRVSAPTEAELRESEILRGLECVGRARQDAGWWRRV